MYKIDFCSILLVLACVLLILVIVLMGLSNIVNSYLVHSAEASMYSKPTWYEITTTTTTEETEEETEETEEDNDSDDEEDDYEE